MDDAVRGGEEEENKNLSTGKKVRHYISEAVCLMTQWTGDYEGSQAAVISRSHNTHTMRDISFFQGGI